MPTLSPDLADACTSLGLKFQGCWNIPGRPALAEFFVADAGSPAHTANFTVALPGLTPAILAERLADKAEQFRQ